MSWSDQGARQRIIASMSNIPSISVRRYAEDYLPEFMQKRQLLLDAKQEPSPPLFKLPVDQAVLVETVQIYLTMVNYDEYRLEEGSESERSQEKALRFLHLYYSACDRVAEKTSAQRVDFHGARMHAAILSDDPSTPPHQSVAEALDFIKEFQAVAEEANRLLANSDFSAEFRIGIDVGTCVAINNGTGSEQEPMFLGSAANHAAKLAEGDEAGIYISDRVRTILDMTPVGQREFHDSVGDNLIEGIVAGAIGKRSGVKLATNVIDEWRSDIQKNAQFDPTSPHFVFSHKASPFSDIDFEDVSPSKSIRMPLLSTYADIDGYTAYIDQCIADSEVANAVKALYVLRREFQAVVEDDFGGKKIRFIGDCIHAVNAEATNFDTDSRATLDIGAKCAGALHSSFKICQEELQYIDELGLAIGLEYGVTPISKIGIRGERAVRVASSVATTESERLQRDCERGETRFGVKAIAQMGGDLRHIVSTDGLVPELTYADVCTALSEQEDSTSTFVYAQPRSPQPARAHLTNE
ncbi:adenylate/guanylate cyclase domain-containing protein [Parvularcula marina]|uniref:adenylate/guanylate cyclase domain-containing protein n=1 Tax=Parvularcula marina TaxID=2292771 RepID=UPI0035146F5E